jgi:predicted deacylase
MAGKKILQVKAQDYLNLSGFTSGEVHRVQIHVPGNPLGLPWKVPVVIAKGKKPGPTMGIVAALHGNELNGLSTIFKLFENIKVERMSGTLVAVPVANIPGFMNRVRHFSDGQDLNRLMPGKLKGTPAEIYNHYLVEKIIRKFDFMLDLHTASTGRINSLYIRADLDNPACRSLAYLQNPQIIVKKFDEGGTLRAWASTNGIPCITIEIGNPATFQHHLIDDTLEGILNTMRFHKMIPGKVRDYLGGSVICDHSSWIYAYEGGIVDVIPGLAEFVKTGDVIARLYNVYGQLQAEIKTDRDGIVIGRSTNPICEAGTRIVHLGQINPESPMQKEPRPRKRKSTKR